VILISHEVRRGIGNALKAAGLLRKLTAARWQLMSGYAWRLTRPAQAVAPDGKPDLRRLLHLAVNLSCADRGLLAGRAFILW